MYRSDRKWAVFISGRGSNLSAILDLQPALRVAVVVSSSAKAHGLTRARRLGVPTLVLPKPIDWPALDQDLRDRGIERIFLAGFMRVVPAAFVESWSGRMLNLHPSLLPAYPGLNSIERAWQEGADLGVTVHEVTAEVDAGRIVRQTRTLPGDRARSLSLDEIEQRIHRDEQRVVREALQKWNL